MSVACQLSLDQKPVTNILDSVKMYHVQIHQLKKQLHPRFIYCESFTKISYKVFSEQNESQSNLSVPIMSLRRKDSISIFPTICQPFIAFTNQAPTFQFCHQYNKSNKQFHLLK